MLLGIKILKFHDWNPLTWLLKYRILEKYWNDKYLKIISIIHLSLMMCLEIIKYWITGSFTISRVKWRRNGVTPATLSRTNLWAHSARKRRRFVRIRKLLRRRRPEGVKFPTLFDRELSPNVAKCFTRSLNFYL